MNICTVAIDADLFDAVKMLIDMKVVDAESVGSYVEQLIQKDIQRRKAEERQAQPPRTP